MKIKNNCQKLKLTTGNLKKIYTNFCFIRQQNLESLKMGNEISGITGEIAANCKNYLIILISNERILKKSKIIKIK